MGKSDEDYIKSIIEETDYSKIFYYNQTDYEQKIINMIDIFGKQFLEEYINSGSIEFIKLEEPIIND